MGKRSLIPATLAALLLSHTATADEDRPEDRPSIRLMLREKIVADFEKATKTSKDAYVNLFDFAAVGEYEILLRRYKLNGRRTTLSDKDKAMLAADDGTPFPEARERRNVGNFYPILAQRTVGTGGCTASEPRTKFAKLMAQPFEPLPAGTPPKYTGLREHANTLLANGGVVAFRCTGGKGGLAVVYTRSEDARGYKLITIYDD